MTRFGLSVVLAATLVPLASLTNAGVATADGGPSVPSEDMASVPVTPLTMGTRPPDDVSDDALDSDPEPENVNPGAGTHTATSLAPSATWNVAGYTGDFSWSYPLRVPPAPGGFEPTLALSYRSSAVDGRTSATNNQASWIGDGWDLSAGFVERTYGACAEDEGGGTVPPKTGDLCWRSDNATTSFAAGGGMLVGNDTDGWRLKDDNGARVERLTGAANGDDNGEHWRITTVDGTQYLFGSQPVSKSTWTVPVFGDDANEPCHATTFADSHCVQAYRWNLDKVIDRHGNVIRYFYEVETNNYGLNMADTAVSYDRGGTLKRVEYGLRDDLPNNSATGKVEFTTANRCVKNSTCAFEQPLNWPDTPLDQRCTATTCADKHAPTFWTTQRLSTITTRVWNGSDYTDVNKWSLGHEFPDPGDGEKAALWLRSITHTGLAGDQITLPAVTFEGTAMANRVYLADGAGWLYRYRITAVVSETGGATSINYADPECEEDGPMPTDPKTNTLRCFPARWVKENWAEREDYFHKYVVEQVTQTDLLSTSTAQVTNYEYLDGAGWHWDTSEFVPEEKKTWNEFRGFGRVRISSGTLNDLAGPPSMVEKRYYRGMDGDRLRPQVDVTDSFGGEYRDHDWLAGFGYETTVFNGVGGPVVSRSITEPWSRGPTAERGPFKAYLVRTGVERGYTALAPNVWRKTRTETDYDEDHGLVTEVNDLGDIDTDTDDRCTRTTYVHNTAKWLLSYSSGNTTVAVDCGQTPQLPEQAISATRVSYDGQAAGAPPTAGNVTTAEAADTWPAAGPVYSVVASSTYDRHGRVLTATNALGKTTATAYTPTVGGPVTQTKVTSPPTLAIPAGLVTTTTVEPAFGQATKVVDPNNRVTETTYDALGRKTRMWLPNVSRANNAIGSIRYTYLIRNDEPSVVTTETIPVNTSTYVVTNELFDGLLRKRQVQTVAVGGGRLMTDIRYDSQGRVFEQTQPYFNNAEVDTTLWVASDVEQLGSARTTYDGAGRTVAQIYRGGAHEKWRTTIGYGGDRVHVTPPDGGTPTTTISDARGQTTELRQYEADTPTGTEYDTTRYTHTPAGDLASVTDPGGNVWRYGYDLRGRQTSVEDPDKGASTHTYDNADQLTSTTDARDVTVAYAYDALGRRTAVHQNSLNGTKLAEWLYDTARFGKGLLASSTRWTNGHPYTTTINGYSALNQASRATVSIPPVEGDLAGDYLWAGTFNIDGTLSSETYPTTDDLASAETVNYVADDLGRPLSSSGAYDGETVELVTGTNYTRLGETELVTLGAGLRAWLSFYYEDLTRRLERTVIDAEVPNPMQADLNYTYDPAGNVTSIADTPAILAQDKQCFRYDHLRRLTEAWTPTGECAPDPTSAGLGGAAPYWHTYGYDNTGNRISETQHATADPATTDLTRTYAYTGHRLDTVTTPGTGGDRVDEYGYDPAGNTTNRVLAGQDETLNWTPEGHLASVNKNGQTTSFVYDADGQRLLRRDASGTTLFLGKQEVEWIQSTDTVRTTRYYTHGGDGPAIATRQGATLSWQAADHHGTAEISINATSMQVQRRRHLPFGAPRGDNPTSWPGQQGFLGGTLDPTTGLTHLGARQYDPTLGRFISVDPLMDLSDPQQMNGYTYSNNNPTTYSDPSGLCPDDGYGNCAPGSSSAPDDHRGNGSQGGGSSGGGSSGGGGGAPEYPYFVGDDVRDADQGDRKRVVESQLTVFRTTRDTTRYEQLLAPYCAEFPGARDCQPTASIDWMELLYQMTSISDAVDCVENPGWNCGALALEFAPFRLFKAFKVLDNVSDASRVSGRTSKAVSCAVGAKSFAPDTHVLMADGTTKPIKDINIGDQVWAANPGTGENGPRTVTAVWSHQDTVLDLVMADGATVTTTEDHPFWNSTDHQWEQAQHLDPGDRLFTSGGDAREVNGLFLPSVRTATAYNLTVDDIHTYYVLAGNAPILVHNSGCSPFTDGSIWDGSFDVGGQNIETMATVRMVGDTVHLDGLMVFAKGGQGLNRAPVGSDAIQQIKRSVAEQARNQGFKTVVLNYERHIPKANGTVYTRPGSMTLDVSRILGG